CLWSPGLCAGPLFEPCTFGETMTDATCYLEPTQESGRAFVLRGITGEVRMLNLLRCRDVADYSASPELAPEAPISGAEAYDRYIAHTLPQLRKSGGDVLFMGRGRSIPDRSARRALGPDVARPSTECGGLHGLRDGRSLSRGHRSPHRRSSGHQTTS